MKLHSALRAVAFFLLGAGAVLLVLEGLLRVLPAVSGLNPSAAAEGAPLRNYEPHRTYRYSYTWAMLNAHRGRTNNYGQIAPHDFRAGSQPLIVVGDSFIESLMNDYGDTLQGILGARLGAGHPVYGLGGSGFSASDYVVIARQARDEFAPAAAVFLISDGDISESVNRRPGGYFLVRNGSQLDLLYQPRSPSPLMSWVREYVGELALYNYVRANLKFSPGDLLAGVGRVKSDGTQSPRVEATAAAERQVAEWFLTELRRTSGVPPECTVLLIDADRYAIYNPRLASVPKDGPATRRYLMERGRALGFRMIDLEPVFRDEYERNRLKFDHWPVDRHWNRNGHSVAANAAMRALFGDTLAGGCMPGGERAAAQAEPSAVGR